MDDELDQEFTETAYDEEAEPEAAPAPEPEPEPEAAPDFDYDPPFLGEEQEYYQPPPQQHQQQQWSPQQAHAYNQYMQQQRGAPQPTQSTLDRFIQDADGTITDIAGRTAQQVAQQLMAQSYGPMAAQMQEFVQGQAKYHTAVSDDKIRNMYKERFTKDETFASNKTVQGHVDNAIRGLRAQAVAMAQRGDPSGFQIFNNPTFAEATLAIAKIMSGSKPGSSGPAPVPHVERTASATRKDAVQIDPDTEAAISKYGPAFREKYLKELAAQDKYNDFTG